MHSAKINAHQATRCRVHLAGQMELFTQLFNIVLIGTISYWYWKVNRPQAYPFKVSIYNFVYAVGGILSIFLFAAETSKFVSAAFACYFAFTGAVHLITNDYEKYKKDAKTFLDSMLYLIVGTGALILIIGYPNTKQMLHPFIFGFAAAFIRGWFTELKAAVVRRESL